MPVHVLSLVFRGKILRQFELAFGGDPNARQVLRVAARKRWVVFSRPPVSGPRQVLQYLGRYTQRTALSNTRILAYEEGEVDFRYRNRADANRSKTLTLAAPEFLRRVLLHVLPKGFLRIRHYGYLANCNRANAVAVCREQLGELPKTKPPDVEPWQDLLLRLTGQDVTRCRSCKTGRNRIVEYLPAVRVAWFLPGRATSP